ncbi:hypothetical protein J132_00426 [Termitomyces sp. J132]|nr:hypothetical protein J132_00426 [Termitomyces sp. J132]
MTLPLCQKMFIKQGPHQRSIQKPTPCEIISSEYPKVADAFPKKRVVLLPIATHPESTSKKMAKDITCHNPALRVPAPPPSHSPPPMQDAPQEEKKLWDPRSSFPPRFTTPPANPTTPDRDQPQSQE